MKRRRWVAWWSSPYGFVLDRSRFTSASRRWFWHRRQLRAYYEVVTR